jgi:hypothetical protein
MSRLIRRLSVAVVALSAFLALGVTSAGHASAAASGTLFATTQAGTVVSVDPASGLRNVVATITAGALFSDPGSPSLYSTVFCSPCADGSAGGQEVVTVNTLTGEVQAGRVITQQFVAIAFDPNSKAIWGISPDCFPCSSPSIVRVDTVTGAETAVTIATPNPVFYNFASMVVASATHTLYVTFGFRGGNQLFALNLTTSAVTNIGTLTAPLTNLGYDGTTGQLLGLTANCSFPGVDCSLDPNPQLVRVDPASAGETSLANFPITTVFFGFAIDSTTGTAYTFESRFSDDTKGDILSINDRTGASIAGATSPNDLGSLAFQLTPVTPQSIAVDVNAAAASGAIDNAGVANSLLAKLRAAADVREKATASGTQTKGCGVAANMYQAFINEIAAQRIESSQARTHITATTANQLISEARFLIANCP